MEEIKEKLPMIMVVILAVLLCFGVLYYLEFQEEVYYTQIDNTKIEQLPTTDSMKFQYTLIAYNEKGRKKEFTFKTSRELRNEAYLKLETNWAVGVRQWEEVQFEELPEKVKVNYAE